MWKPELSFDHGYGPDGYGFYDHDLYRGSDEVGTYVYYDEALEAIKNALEKYGAHHTNLCVVSNRWRNDDGTHCDCGFRDIVGGNDGEPDAN